MSHSRRTLAAAALSLPHVLFLASCGIGAGGTADATVDAGRDSGNETRDAAPDADAIPHLPPYVDASTRCEAGQPWGPCGVFDASVLACDSSADCTWQSDVPGCCGILTFGVNKSAPPLECPGLPCPPPKVYQPACQLYATQTCELVEAGADIALECISHRCITSAKAP